MFYVTKELLKKLSPEDQGLVKDEGITMEQMDAMSDKEKAMLMDEKEPDVQAPDENPSPDDEEGKSDPMEKADDETKLPKSTKYGDEDQFETKLTEDGHMEELPNSKKNEIGNFDDAAERGMALLDKMARMPDKKPMPKKKIKQEELDGETDDSQGSE